LLPRTPTERAHVRAVAAIIRCDIYPLHNIGPLPYLRRKFGRSKAEVAGWISEWVGKGLAAVESLIGDDGSCFRPHPGLADIYLIPQLDASRRFGRATPNAPLGRVSIWTNKFERRFCRCKFPALMVL
jgi:glutathione S-transferase